MPPKVVEVPGVGMVEFPETMPDSAIEAVLRSAPATATPAAEMPWGDVARDIGSKALGVAQGVADVATRSALPTLGGALAGGAAALTPVGKIPGVTPAMTGLGSMVGVKANELLGVEQPTGLDYGLAGGAPFLAAGIREGIKRLPGAAGGLQQVAVGTAEGLAGKMGTTVAGQTADALYAQVRALNPRIPTGPIQTALADLTAAEGTIAKSLKDPAIRKALAGVDQLIHPAPGATAVAIDFNALYPNMKRLGSMIDAAEQKGGDVGRTVKTLYKSMREALDQASSVGGVQGAEVLAQANQAFRRELAQRDIRQIVTAGISRGGPGLKQGNFNAMLDKLDKGKVAEDLADLVKRDPGLKTEIDGVRAALTTLTETPSIGKSTELGLATSPSFGVRHVVGSVLGATVGSLLPGSAGVVAGATAGILATEALSNALMSRPGRGLVVALAKHGYGADQIINILLQAGRPRVAEMGRAPRRE